MANELDDLFLELEQATNDTIIRSPIPYPGGKSRSIKKLMEYLPYRRTFVDVFGGSGTVILSRQPSKIEVFNDIHSGLVAFYRCIKDPAKLEGLKQWLEATVYSREDFLWSKETWEYYVGNDVECAARWYYMVNASFGSMGRSFGRATQSVFTNKIRNKIPLFDAIHERFKNIIIEHEDWSKIVKGYDSHETVFYLDPPYLEAYDGAYSKKQVMSIDEHRQMLNTIQDTKGFVALSGYDNPLYNDYDWSDKFEWDVYVSIRSASYTETNNKAHLADTDDGRGRMKECLWIKN